MNTEKKILYYLKIVLMLAVLIYAPLANAQGTPVSGSGLSLTLAPVRVEIAGNPGETVQTNMTLSNNRDVEQTFYSSFTAFEAQGETGIPNYVVATEGLATWMHVPESITLAPLESRKITLAILIPKDAEPGGNFAVVFWGNQPPAVGTDQVAVGGKFGMLVLLRVNGEIKESGTILNYQTKDNRNFYTSLPVSFTYRFQNTGSDRVKPGGDIVVRNMLGLKSAVIPANKVEGNVLPHSIRKFETFWQKKNSPPSVDSKEPERSFFEEVGYQWHNFALGRYVATMNLVFASDKQTATGSVSFWVFPWQLLIVLTVLLLLAYFIIRKILRGYNRWIIQQAQENIEHELGMDEEPRTHKPRKIESRKNYRRDV